MSRSIQQQVNLRVPEIDSLRGLALFGILMVNFSFFAMPEGSIGNYASLAFPEWWNTATVLAVQFLCDGKFILIFSFLFGWGLKSQMERIDFRTRYFRRLSGLFMIGILHALLLFVGDILVTYAILGVPLYFVRNWKPQSLVQLAISMWLLSVVAHCVLGLMLPLEAPKVLADYQAIVELHQTGSWWAIAYYRLEQLIGLYLITPLLFAPQVMGMFALGLAFGKTYESLSCDRLAKTLPWVVGLTIVPAVFGNFAYAWLSVGVHHSSPTVALLSVAGRGLFAPLLALSYLAMAIPFFSSNLGKWIGRRIAGDGRCSMSLYLGESLVMGWLFNSYGLGLYGRIGPWIGALLCLGVYLALLAMGKAWLQFFRLGPSEWLLRLAINAGTSAGVQALAVPPVAPATLGIPVPNEKQLQ
jgi:uncharacterized protein